MNAPPHVPRPLRMEALETRTLLAADLADPYGLVADFNLAMHAVSGTGDFQASFSSNFGNHQLVLSGTSATSLTIDLDQLPAFITNLSISTFGNVQILGTDHVDNLILTSIGSVSAQNLSVSQGSSVKDVGSLSIASLGINAVFSGSDTKLTATSLDGTTIISDLHSLTLTSNSKEIQFIAVGTDYEQTLNLTYLPQILGTWGIPKTSIHVVLPSNNNDTSTPVTPPIDTPPVTPPVDTQPTTPPVDTQPVTQPVDPQLPSTTPGTSDPTDVATDPTVLPSSSDTDRLVIVSLPLDEATRAFLSQLRELLHSSQADAQQWVLDLLRHNSLAGVHPTNATVAEKLAASDPTYLLTGDPLRHEITDLGAFSLGHAALDLSPPTPFVERFFTRELSVPVPQSLETGPTTPFVGGVMDVQVTWPVAIVSAAQAPAQPGMERKSADGDLQPKTLAESVTALGNYIVERVSAEFSPGHQSLVLLVDPQPARNAGANRKSSVDRLNAGLESSVASVESSHFVAA